MKKWLPPLLVLILTLAFILPRFIYYQGKYSPPPITTPAVGKLFIPTLAPGSFVDTYQQAQGTLVIDTAHGNYFDREEIALLTQRVLARGYRVEFMETKGKGKESGQPTPVLEEKLRLGQSLVVVLPGEAYTSEEARLIRAFLNKGGRVLLIGDATRASKINSLAVALGITFENDYLYNQIENDGNFRDVFFSTFKESQLTQGLRRIALYSASSLSPASWGVVMSDANTFSVGIATPGPYSPILLRPDGLVLALADLTFLSEPYSSVADNHRFISNIADWLTASQRRFSLSDFPYFLDKSPRLEVATADLVPQGLELKKILEAGDKAPVLAQLRGGGNFTFLGLFQDGEKVARYLEAGDISVKVEEVKEEGAKAKATPEGTKDQGAEPTKVTKRKVTLEVAGLGDVYRQGSALIYLHQKEGQSVLIILGDDEKALSAAIAALEAGEFRDWLINDSIALHLPPKDEKPRG